MDTSVVAFDLIWAATIVLFLMIIFAPVACSLSYITMVLAVVGEKWLDRVQGAWYVVYVPPLDLVTWTWDLLIVYVSSCCCASSLLRFWVLFSLGLSEIFSQIVQVDEFHPVLMRAQKNDKHQVFQTEGFRPWANNLCKGTAKILSIQPLGDSWAMLSRPYLCCIAVYWNCKQFQRSCLCGKLEMVCDCGILDIRCREVRQECSRGYMVGNLARSFTPRWIEVNGNLQLAHLIKELVYSNQL